MAEQRISYTGERIDIGIDVHKETYTVTCLCQRQMVKTATVPADPARLAESLRRWFPGARLFSAYEAGFSGFVLHRILTTAGITNIWRTGAYAASMSRQKPRNWRGSSPAPAPSWSRTAPPSRVRSKPSCINLASSLRAVGA
jgi:hypothetical protein